jgi:hypothetical protein
MKRTLATLLATVAMAIGSAAAFAGSNPATDDKFKACADYSITASNAGNYVVDSSGVGVLNFRYTMADPSCKEVFYSFTVYSGNSISSTHVLWQDIRQGDGETATFFENASFITGPQSVCVVGQTSSNGQVYDIAPETGCKVLTNGAPPSAQGFF